MALAKWIFQNIHKNKPLMKFVMCRFLAKIMSRSNGGKNASNFLFGILNGRQILLYLHPIRRLAVISFLVIVGCWSVMSFGCNRGKFSKWTCWTLFGIRVTNESNHFFLNLICAPYDEFLAVEFANRDYIFLL